MHPYKHHCRLYSVSKGDHVHCHGKIGQDKNGPTTDLVDQFWSGQISFGIQNWFALTKNSSSWVKCKFTGQVAIQHSVHI